MADWFTRPLAALFPSVRWFAVTGEVWLTFDDGPHPTATAALLDVLRQEDVRATFFLLGERVERHPSVVRAIHDAGHVIGNHGYDHQPVWSMGGRELGESLCRTNDAVVAAKAPLPKLYRPTYGRFHPGTVRVARHAGLEMMMFGVNSWDFAGGETSVIVDRVTKRSVSGDILLFHDNDATNAFIATVVRDVIRHLRAEGLAFGTPERP